MFCPNCGSKMNDGASFCSNCGWKNEKNQQSASMPNISMPNIKNFVPIIIGIVVVFVLIFAIKGFISSRHCKYDGCENEVYKEGYCQNHYSKKVAKENINDVLSGEKSWQDAARDTYDKSFSKEQKKQIEDSINDIKNSFGNFFGN